MARSALTFILPLSALVLASCQKDSPEKDSPEAGEPCETWYLDEDGDGYGTSDSAFDSCDPPAGAVRDTGDSDDTDSSIFPGATELCDGVQSDSADADWAGDAGRATWFPDGGDPQPVEAEDSLTLERAGELCRRAATPQTMPRTSAASTA